MNDDTQIDHLQSFSVEYKSPNFLSQGKGLLLLVSIAILFIPVFCWVESVVIYIDKPRVFISGDIFIYIISTTLASFWITYTFFSKRLLTRYLIWIHVITTLGILMLFLATSTWALKSSAENEVQETLMRAILLNKQYPLRISSIFGIIFTLGQLAFLVNIFGGFFYRKYKKGT